jgi:RNA 2',3'-cyclic 3'-phosphodiesterase
MRQVRAFLAIPVTEELVREVMRVRKDLAVVLPGFRWVRPEAMHLTLKFFGNIAEDCLEKIGEIMLSIGRLSTPFQAELAGIGAFPSPTRPRVIWIGMNPGQPLVALHSLFDRELASIGILRDDRPFTPHLTLGRSRGPTKVDPVILEPFREVRCGILPVDRVILFESRLQPDGAVHLPVKTVYLAGMA